jgi:hypothetical protein
MENAKNLVDKMLSEADPVNPSGAPNPPGGPGTYGPDRFPTPGAAARQQAADEEGDDIDEVDPEDQFEMDLREALEGNDNVTRVNTFEENGVLTRNRGLVVTTNYGRFQVTIVHDGR